MSKRTAEDEEWDQSYAKRAQGEVAGQPSVPQAPVVAQAAASRAFSGGDKATVAARAAPAAEPARSPSPPPPLAPPQPLALAPPPPDIDAAAYILVGAAGQTAPTRSRELAKGSVGNSARSLQIKHLRADFEKKINSK